MRTLFLVAAVLTAAFAAAQEGEAPKLKKSAPATVDRTSPVTRAEATAVFTRMTKAVGQVLKIDYGNPVIGAGAQPVTRAEVVAEMGRIFDKTRPAFKFTPKKVKFDSTRLTLTDAKNRPVLEKLIGFGTVAKIGPIAAGSEETLTAAQFGDAVGFFLARLSDLTHTPSAKWSPSLMP